MSHIVIIKCIAKHHNFTFGKVQWAIDRAQNIDLSTACQPQSMLKRGRKRMVAFISIKSFLSALNKHHWYYKQIIAIVFDTILKTI